MDLAFGHFRLKRAERLLDGPGGDVPLSARSFDILALLLSRPDAVVGKSELLETVWPGLIVEDNTLQVHVSALRRALAPGMIVTVHGRGYKYAGPPPRALAPAPPAAPLPASPAGRKPVIAVLPFATLGGDPGETYFGDGLTEDLIVELSRYRPLQVVSRQSSSHFRGPAVDVAEAAGRLGADYLVEGSVRRADDRVRITARLVEAATTGHVWAERYDRRLDDLFAVQDDLVRRLVSTVTGEVERHTDTRARAKPTENLDAYDCWLRAQHSGPLWSVDGNSACQRLLEEALRRDPLFARAHASLAYCHIRSATLAPGSPQIPALHEAALASAEQAIQVDPAEARAHTALGWSLMYLRRFDRARQAFAQSAAQNPNDGAACIDRALALAFLGERAAADEAAALAEQLNPLGGEWYSWVRACVHFTARRHDEAEVFIALAPPHLPDALTWHAANLGHLGRTREAAEAMGRALDTLARQWHGPAPMQPADFLAWYRFINMMRHDEDWQHLRAGLAKAGFPEV